MATPRALRLLVRPSGLLGAAAVVGLLTIGGVMVLQPHGGQIQVDESAAPQTSLPNRLSRATTTTAGATSNRGTILLPGAAAPTAGPGGTGGAEQATATTLPAADAGGATNAPSPGDGGGATSPGPGESSGPGPGDIAPTTTAPATTSTAPRPVRPGQILVSDGQFVQVVGADGGDLRTIVQGHAPAWRPDGRRFAFAFSGAVWVSDPADAAAINMLLANADAPVWSPDGSRVALVRAVGGQSQLWTVNADGSNPQALVAAAGAFANSRGATWSPDGSVIAFAFGNPGTPGGIATISAVQSGAQPNVLIADSGTCCAHEGPAWSPDGTSIAWRFIDAQRGASSIRVLHLADKGTVDVLGGPASPPAWAPDSIEVVASTTNGLVAAPVAGGGPLRVLSTTRTLDTGRPSWR